MGSPWVMGLFGAALGYSVVDGIQAPLALQAKLERESAADEPRG